MKLIPENNDLLNDEGLDEMQKTYAYKLAFKCFKALYWITFLISLIILLLSTAIEESVIFATTALVLELSSSIVYVIFGAKASKVGAMSPKFAINMAKPGTIIGYFAMTILYVTWFAVDFMKERELYFIFCGIYILIDAGTFIVLGFIAKRNNKIIEKTEEEE